jgi:DNA (cytosine-5)-methyltransferase 1
VDTTQTTHLGLCAGYGGIDLGLKRVLPNLRTVALCEIEAFAIANLVAKMEAGLMDPAPIWTDLKTFPWAEFCDRVDILTGGYPCQPFSAAGKRLGTEDPRHLWPYIASGIRLLRPRACFFENVEGHITLGLSSVISDLEELGYEVSWGIFSAAECGAPHQRKRVFILGNSSSKRCEEIWRCWGSKLGPSGVSQICWQGNNKLALASGFGGAAGISGSLTGHEGITGITDDCGAQRWPSRPGQPQHYWEPPRVVGNAALFNGTGQAAGQRETQVRGTSATQHDQQAEPALGGDANGPANRLDDAELYTTCDNRTDELRLLGNGVVPATAALAFKALMKQIGKWEEVQG